MNKFFASLLCCSLTLPMLIQAEQSSSSQTPSQKKFTRKEIVEASKNSKTPPKAQPKKKAPSTPAKTSAAAKKNSAPPKSGVITNTEKKPQKSTPKKNFYAKSPQAILAVADDSNDKNTAAEPTVERNCDPGPNSFRFSMSHREGKGIGYDQGYTSLDMFFMFSQIGNVRPFFDLRGHMTNNGKPAANVGFGVRYLPDTINAVFGLNTFFDFRQARHSTYEQIGVGLEILGTQWNFQANGYFPIIKTSNVIDVNFFEFKGNSALVHIQRELALTGCDASVGRSLIHRGYFDLDAYLGGYYFQGHRDLKAPGAYLKLASSLTPYISVDIQGSYDTLFKAIFQGAASLNIPLGKRVKTGNPNRTCYQETALARNFTDPVSRFEMIVTHLDQQTSIGLDPRTGEPLSIVFVNNLVSAGNGTFESPFATLALAEANSAPGQMILVYSGTGTNTGMNAGITLQDSQWLQSGFFSFGILSSAGPVTVPAVSSQYPLITNIGDGITLANNNIVTGFHINASSNNIIGVGITGAQITDNILTGAANRDIALGDVSGNVSIENNTMTSNVGLFINTSDVVQAEVFSNNFNNAGTFNVFINLAGSSRSDINIEDNVMQGSADGLSIQLNDSAISYANISGNTLNNMTGAAGALNIDTLNGSVITANIFNNSFTNSITGISVSSSNTSTATFNVIKNFVVNNASTTSAGFSFLSDNSSIMNICLATNTSNAPVGYFLLNNTSTATMNVQSPNGQESGVQSVNIGSLETSGTINYTPYDPPYLRR